MKLTDEKRMILEEYFNSLELNQYEQERLFWYIDNSENIHEPLFILGDPTTGKTTLTDILRYFGVRCYTPHSHPCITLRKKIDYSDDRNRAYIREVLQRLTTEARD